MRRISQAYLLALAIALPLIANGEEEEQTVKIGGTLRDSFELNGVPWQRHLDVDGTGKYFYVNVNTGKSTWDDPRVEAAREASNRLLVVVLVLLPFALLATGGAAYIAYLKKYHPQFFKPTKKGKGHKKIPTKATTSPSRAATTVKKVPSAADMDAKKAQ